MNCYKKIKLACLEEVQEYLVNRISTTLTENEINKVVSEIIVLPSDLVSVINLELDSYNIPAVEYCRIYLRPRNDVQFPHIDGSTEILHCAINIPLRGGKDSKFQWLGGDFELGLVDLPRTNQKAYAIKWNSAPEVIESIEMIDGCYLVRIDQPHQAIASPDSDRWVFTMRFKGNPTFEELYSKLPANNI